MQKTPADIDTPESAVLVSERTQNLRKVGHITVESAHVRRDGSIIRDITERKRTEEVYGTILRTTMDGFWRVDSSGRFLDMNEVYCRMIGYGRAELLEMRVQDVEARECAEETARHIKRTIESGSDRFETRHRRKNGELINKLFHEETESQDREISSPAPVVR